MHRAFGLSRGNFIATFLHTRSFNILRRTGSGVKRKTSENQRFSEEFIGLIDPSVTPERFISAGVKFFVYQCFIILENHGCSLFAHPEISMFFVYLQHKDSYNSLTNSNH